jgi:hypothetical protein
MGTEEDSGDSIQITVDKMGIVVELSEVLGINLQKGVALRTNK